MIQAEKTTSIRLLAMVMSLVDFVPWFAKKKLSPSAQVPVVIDTFCVNQKLFSHGSLIFPFQKRHLCSFVGKYLRQFCFPSVAM